MLLFMVIICLIAGTVSAVPAVAKKPGLWIARVGQTDDAAGTAVISGKASCSGPGRLTVHAHVRQTTASESGVFLTVHGDGYTVVVCTAKGASATWRVNVFSPSGPLVSGKAECFASASLDGAMAGSSGYSETAYVRVRLRPDRGA